MTKIKNKESKAFWSLVDNNPKIAWNWEHLVKKDDVVLPILIKLANNKNSVYNGDNFMNDYQSKWKWLTTCPAVNMDMIESTLNDNDTYHWSLDMVTLNPNVTIEFVNKYIIDNKSCTNTVFNLSYNTNTDLRFIDEFPNFNWVWRHLSYNKNITLEFVVKYSDKNWNWDILSYHPNLTFDFIDALPDKPWHWSAISRSKFALLAIEKYPDKDWNMANIRNNKYLSLTHDDLRGLEHKLGVTTHYLAAQTHTRVHSDNSDNDSDNIHVREKSWGDRSEDPKLNLQQLVDNVNEDWNWYQLTINPAISLEFIDLHSNEPDKYKWRWYDMHNNPNMNFEFITKHVDKEWDWQVLSYFTFNDPIRRLQKQYKRNINKLAKTFYWNCVTKMSLPPTGYYFLNDFRDVIPHDKRHIFDTLRTNKDFKQIQLQFLS